MADAGGWTLDFYDFLKPLPADDAVAEDVYKQARQNGARQGTPLFVSPSGVPDARLNLFFRTGVMASRRPGAWRRYAYSLVVWLDFLDARGRGWGEATARDVEAFKDWRLTDDRNPERVPPGAFDVDRAALNAFYTWANGWYGVVNPVPAVSTGRGTERPVDGARRREPLRPAGAARRQVKWMLRPAYEQWRDIGLRGYGFDGTRRPEWRGFTEDRDVAFTDGLYGTGLRVAGVGERPGRGAAGRGRDRPVPAGVAGRGVHQGRPGGAYLPNPARRGRRDRVLLRRSSSGRRRRRRGRVEQDPGLVRVEETRRDESASQQVAFGAGEAVGVGEHGSGAGAGGQYGWDPGGEFIQRRHQLLRHVTDAERGDHHTVDPLGEPVEQHTVVA